MKIVGVTRIRNESHIIQKTLDHVAEFVDEIVVYDDCSTDNTVEICEAHKAVVKVIRGDVWANDPAGRNRMEGIGRQIPFEEARKNGADWVYYFDADEYAEIDRATLLLDDPEMNGYRMRLLDAYITPEDAEKPFTERKWFGPEYRDILMWIRVTEQVRFGQREPRGVLPEIGLSGYVKHYGKAISLEEWDKTCEYYATVRWPGVRNDLAKRWADRKGKAIKHDMKSDFGNPLIQWEDRKTKEFKLTS